MHISKVKITNILGIDELEFQPGQFNAFTGGNGSGKTSALEAIKAALKGGHDATLLRNGADKGEVVLVLDDGTEITKRVTAATSDTKVRTDGKAVSKPAEAIKRLTDLLSVNPVEFLSAAKKDRVQILLESMPVEIDTVYLSEISGAEVDAGMAAAGLACIDVVRKTVFDDRTGTNRAAKEKQGTINQLRATVPEALAAGGGDNSADLVNQINAVDAKRDAEFVRIATKLNSLRDERDKKLDELNVEIAKIKESFSETERLANAQREKKAAEFANQREAISVQLSAIQEAQKAAARHQQTLDTVSLLAEELATLEAEAETQTTALADIDKYKSDLLEKLPISGLEVRDGEIYRNDVLFDRLNTAQQVEIAVEIAKLRSGELGVICVDGLELLDEEHYEAFRDACQQSGLQLFVTRVGDGDFSINQSTEEF